MNSASAILLTWMGMVVPMAEAIEANSETPGVQNDGQSSQRESAQDNSKEVTLPCSCAHEPPIPPETLGDIHCCHRRIVADLAAADFSPENPHFVAAMKRAIVLVLGLENRILALDETVAEDDAAAQEDAIDLEQLAVLLRINVDRVQLVSSSRIRDVYRRRTQEEGGPWSEEDKNAFAEIVEYANNSMRYSYFDNANVSMGILWRRGIYLAGNRLDLGERVRRIEDAHSVIKDICDVDISEGTGGHSSMLRADDYLSRALLAVGKSGLTSSKVREYLLVDRARLRVTVSPGHVDEEKWLLAAVRDLQDAFRGDHIEGTIRDIGDEAYGFAVKRLACKYVKEEDYQKAYELAGLLDVGFSWTEKEALYLLVARDAALPAGRKFLASQLLAKGYNNMIRKLDIGYLDLVEDWPLEFFGKMFGMNATKLRVVERKVAKKKYFREIVSSHLPLSPYDCQILQEYLRVLEDIPTPEALTQARSLSVRVGSEVCLSSSNGGNSNIGERR